MAAPGAIFADDFARVTARGNRLVLRLQAPAPDLLSRLALPFFCAVPPRTPIAPNGLSAPLPSAGPYFIAEWAHNRLVVLRRNPHYRGPRPRGAARIELAIGQRPGDSVARVETGAIDWYPIERASPQVSRGKRARVARTTSTRMLVFNNRSGRPFAAKRLRMAVAHALNRTELARVGGYPYGTPTDRLISPLAPGYRPGRLYPLRLSEPSRARARALAAGHVPASVVLVASNRAPASGQAEMIKVELRAIGIEVKVQLFPSAIPECWPARDWDLTLADWRPDHTDPSALFRHLFEGLAECVVEPPGPALDAAWRKRFAAADSKSGPARLRALGRLELDLLAKDLPATGLYVHNALNLFSERIGCAGTHHVYVVDLAALCLRR